VPGGRCDKSEKKDRVLLPFSSVRNGGWGKKDEGRDGHRHAGKKEEGEVGVSLSSIQKGLEKRGEKGNKNRPIASTKSGEVGRRFSSRFSTLRGGFEADPSRLKEEWEESNPNLLTSKKKGVKKMWNGESSLARVEQGRRERKGQRGLFFLEREAGETEVCPRPVFQSKRF